MDNFNHPLAITTLAHVLTVFVIGVRVVMKRPAPGVAFAWLLLVVMLPFAGALLYLLMGERRVGPERRHRMDALASLFGRPGGDMPWADLADGDWSRQPRAAAGLNQLGCKVGGSVTVHGNDIALYSDPEKVLQAIASDIDTARTGVSMSFYIWNEGGGADDVLAAVIRAAQRGVACRILVDALGARPWLKGSQPERLRAAGVQVQPALPVGLFRSFVGRTDLRLHRKLVVIDGAVAWTGSMNLADPRTFKQDAGVGEWIDAMVRLRGSVVAPLGLTAQPTSRSSRRDPG